MRARKPATDPDASNDASSDTTLIVPEGVFGDGFENPGSGLRVPAARRAQTAGVRAGD